MLSPDSSGMNHGSQSSCRDDRRNNEPELPVNRYTGKDVFIYFNRSKRFTIVQFAQTTKVETVEYFVHITKFVAKTCEVNFWRK